MWKSKKFILILTIAILALIGGTTGAVMAATGDATETQAESQHEAMLDRICEIYEENTGVAIDPDQLQSAFDQARDEMQEQVMVDRLQELVDEGEITQEEADQYLAWWQSRPDIGLPGLVAHEFGSGMVGGRGFHHLGAPPCITNDSGEALAQ